MEAVTAKLVQSKRWWSRGLETDFTVTARLTEFELSPVTEAVAGMVFGDATFNEGGPRLLVNAKGQSPGSSLIPDEQVPENELLHFTCDVATSASDESYEWEPGALAVTTALLEYTDALRYDISTRHAGALSTDVPAIGLGRVPNIRPRTVRLTFEVLTQSFVSNLVGGGAKPLLQVAISADESSFYFRAHIDEFQNAAQNPFDVHPILSSTNRAFQSILNTSLAELYRSAQKEK